MNPKSQNSNEEPTDVYEHSFDLSSIPEVQLSGHQWIQMGNELRCTSCSFTHGTYISSDYQLYGIDDSGKPLIRKIVVKD